jgi:hypothetical protein
VTAPTTTEDDMTTFATRAAGPVAVAAGGLMIAGQLLMWPVLDRSQPVGTVQQPLYQVAGYLYLLAFCLLQLTVVAVAAARRAGRRRALHAAGLAAASVGTTLLAGDLWFETFVVPWLADGAPASLTMPRVGTLVAGALVSYVLFALGWAFFGVTGLLSRALPVPLGLAFVPAGLLGFSALMPPNGIPLGLCVLALGVVLLRARGRRRAVAATLSSAAVP